MIRSKEKGITLVGLVITVIILLILAGVAISAIIGDEGIFSKVKYSAEKYTNEAKSEAEIVNKLTNSIENSLVGDEETPIAYGKYNELKGVNSPEVQTGMIPIKYNGTNWVICDETDIDWYDYIAQTGVTTSGGTGKWANVMLSDGTYKATSAVVGQVIQENELGSMFVWIPRFAYNITSGYRSSTAGEIQIEFMKGITNISATGRTTYSNSSGQGNWNIHPAFRNGTSTGYTNGEWEKEIPGFWIAKFESTNSNNSVKVVPGAQSWKGMVVGDMFTICRNMELTNASQYGINSEKIDTHLIKNSEYGAVAYLTHSKYGRNKTEITINSNTSAYTGGGSGSAYKTNILQSTTGNITGVYDLSGGLWEYVAAYVANNNAILKTNATGLAYDNVTSQYITASTKYVTVYTVGSSDARESNLVANLGKYGDAVAEISGSGSNSTSWNGDYSYFVYSTSPVFIHGGSYGSTTNAGIFAYYSDSGNNFSYCGFRACII